MTPDVEYSEYEGDPKTWKHRSLPLVDEHFIKQLEDIGTVNGFPRFRVVDPAKVTETHDGITIPKYPYALNIKVDEEWIYFDDGETIRVKTSDDVPQNKLAVPSPIIRHFAIPRYVVEVYRHTSEPMIREHGYTYAWIVHTVRDTNIKPYSEFRNPGAKDLMLARKCLALIERTTASHIRKVNKEKVKQYAINS